MTENDLEVVFSAGQLSERIAELGAEISRDYRGEELIAVCVMRGSFVFAADLFRSLDADLRIDFLEVTRYGDKDVPDEELRVISDVFHDVRGKHVLLVEDIVDEGNTLWAVKRMLEGRNPASLKICALFDKPARRRKPVRADYVGFTIEDRFVIGFGMDYKQKYRNIPYLAAVKKR